MEMKTKPILFIHGFGGSKLNCVNKVTNKQQLCWIRPTLDVDNQLAQYLWGQYDADLNEYKSFTSKYLDIVAVDGIVGCDFLVEMLLFRQASNQFGSVIKHFESKGYKLEENLFAFTYDWRQPLNNDQIMNKLDHYIKTVYHKFKSKIQVVTHSMGGLLMEVYMRQHPAWGTFISKFIAIACPFDGASGEVNASLIFGYNMQLPIKQSTLKGIEASCGSIPFVMSKQKRIIGQQGLIFVKKLKDSKGCDEIKYFKQQNLLSSSLRSNQLAQSQHQKTQIINQQFCIDDIELNKKVYNNDIPDLFFTIAEKIKDDTSLISQENLEQTFNILQCGCKSGAIVFKNRYNSKQLQKRSIMEVVEPKYKSGLIDAFDLDLEEEVDFEWETYASYSTNAAYTFKKSRFAHFDEAQKKIVFTRAFQRLFKNKNLFRQPITQTLFGDVRDYFQALHLFNEQSKKSIGNSNSKRFADCCFNILCFQQEEKCPLFDTAKMLQKQCKSFDNLSSNVHIPGSLAQILFKTDGKAFENAAFAMTQKIDFQQCVDFKFASVCGIGVPTPFHAIYQKPVRNYSELLHQPPEFTYQQGDGTVPVISALADPFPQEYVVDRVVLNVSGHLAMLQDQNLYSILDDLLEYE